MALTGTDLALLTARFGCARFGASRFGFIPCPEDVHGVGFDEPGEYIWKEVKPPTTSWTLQTEDCVCGQRPVAAFSNVLCNAVGPVAFTDTSTPADQITFWYWTFGDGGTSNLQNPTHTYAAGYFTVTLTISSEKGSATATGYVSVMSALVASAAPNPVDEGVDVTFTPTFSGGLAPYTYQWQFEADVLWDGIVHAWPLTEAAGTRKATAGSVDMTPVANPGNAAGIDLTALSLIAANSEGVSSGSSISLPPSFTLSFWYNGAVASEASACLLAAGTTWPQVIQVAIYRAGVNNLILRVSNGVSGEEVIYAAGWGTGAWVNIVVTYDDTSRIGTMYVNALGAFDAVGAATAAFSGSRRTGPDIVTLGHSNGMFVNDQYEGLLSQAIVWPRILTQAERARIYDTGTGLFFHGSTEEIPVYAYPTSGAKVASLTVTSATGCTITDTVAVTVNASTLAVTFAMDPDPTQQAVDKDTVITFTPTVTPGIAPYTYDWDWGDGEAHGVTEIPTHTYDGNPLGGTYTVVLTVTDAALATATDSQTIDIAGV